jgi:hypothetical protein
MIQSINCCEVCIVARLKKVHHKTKNYCKKAAKLPTEFPIVWDKGIKANTATDGVTRSAFSKHTEQSEGYRESECGHVLPDD